VMALMWKCASRGREPDDQDNQVGDRDAEDTEQQAAADYKRALPRLRSTARTPGSHGQQDAERDQDGAMSERGRERGCTQGRSPWLTSKAVYVIAG